LRPYCTSCQIGLAKPPRVLKKAIPTWRCVRVFKLGRSKDVIGKHLGRHWFCRFGLRLLWIFSH
jgi:hypothetical protein